jgi:rubredoxin
MANFSQRQMEQGWVGLTATVGVPTCPICRGTGWELHDIIGDIGGETRWRCLVCGYLLVFDSFTLFSHSPSAPGPITPSV